MATGAIQKKAVSNVAKTIVRPLSIVRLTLPLSVVRAVKVNIE